MNIPSHFQLPSRPSSPRPMPRISEIQRPYSPLRMGSLNFDQNGCMPRVAPHPQLFNPSYRAFSIPRSTPPSPRSPSVASWASFDTDYDDGLIIEEIDTDDENPTGSGIEVLVGEYEDPPSDDEYWERRRSSMHDTVIEGFEELATSKSSPPCKFLVSPRSERSPISATPSKRSYLDSASSDDNDTDREENFSEFGRRTRRRLQPKSPLKQSSTLQIMRGFTVAESPLPGQVNSDMEE